MYHMNVQVPIYMYMYHIHVHVPYTCTYTYMVHATSHGWCITQIAVNTTLAVQTKLNERSTYNANNDI